MSRVKWDQIGERTYETGVKRGVVYPQTNGTYGKGAAWNGLTAVNESPSGAEATPLYANDTKYGELISNEDFGFGIEAYTYPEEFGICIGEGELAEGVSIKQQKRSPFGFTYVNTIGNDTEGTDYGYNLHLVYGAMAAPSEKSNPTINDSPEAQTMSWECTTTPVDVTVGDGKFKPTSHIVINSVKADPEKLAALEAILYGKDGEPASEARLPLPDEVYELMQKES